MPDIDVFRKLESIKELPTIPYVISEVLNALEDQNIRAASLAALIERDQTLTVKVLRVANSPFYGFTRKISTIDLAIVVLGLDSIKEIVLTLVVQRVFSKVKSDVFDLDSFWKYSVFCAAGSRLLARKLGYKLAGEAFVAGLMHDIGILVLVEHFTDQFIEIVDAQSDNDLTFIEAERMVLSNTHCDIGHWLAEKWNLPDQLNKSIKHHHSSMTEILNEKRTEKNIPGPQTSDIEEPLTAIVAMGEWFAKEMSFKNWAKEIKSPPLFLANEVLEDLQDHEVLDPNSVLDLLKAEILEEYEKATIFRKLPTRPLY